MSELNLNGLTEVPAGKLATIVTYLEMRERPKPARIPDPDGVALRHVRRPSPAWYRALYRRVGENWLWFSRLVMADAELTAILANERVEVHAVTRQGAEIGLLELDFRAGPDVEIAFFGLVPDATGSGLGRWLIERAIALAYARSAARLWVHTCTFDHPGALPLYMRAGLRPYKRAVELFDDPRLSGHLPRDKAPHVPLIEPDRRARSAQSERQSW